MQSNASRRSTPQETVDVVSSDDEDDGFLHPNDEEQVSFLCFHEPSTAVLMHVKWAPLARSSQIAYDPVQGLNDELAKAQADHASAIQATRRRHGKAGARLVHSADRSDRVSSVLELHRMSMNWSKVRMLFELCSRIAKRSAFTFTFSLLCFALGHRFLLLRTRLNGSRLTSSRMPNQYHHWRHVSPAVARLFDRVFFLAVCP